GIRDFHVTGVQTCALPILNSYTVCSDWLNWNTGWWRGMDPDGEELKWRYILWDMDATFDHYANFTGIGDESANADPCQAEELPKIGRASCRVSVQILMAEC